MYLKIKERGTQKRVLKVHNMNEPFYILRHFTINSYNCMMFTLSIDVYDMATDKFIGKLYITKTRQEFWKVA
mgnify:CR=1 FL=1|jgi:hypothetical protein